MPDRGIIYALDLGSRSGFAAGPAGQVPRSGAVILKRDDESRSAAFSNLIVFLNEEWSTEKPDLVAKEAPIPLQAFAKLGNAEKTVRFTYGLHAIVEGMCARFGIQWVEEHNQTVRKHFLGLGRVGSRKETKAAVVKRCHLLQLLPQACHDDDRADAVSIHDWAASSFARRSVSGTELFLFGERA